MSYDIELTDPVSGETIQFDSPHHMRGGTYCVDATKEAWLNITWNYSKFFYNTMGEKGIRTIYGTTGADSIPILQAAADQLKNDATKNYWDSTEGNAKRALLQLIAMAKMRPDGIWAGD